MRRCIASLLLTLLICQSALAGAIEVRHCGEAASHASHHASIVHQADFGDDGDEIHDVMHDHDQGGANGDDSCGLCGGACMVSEIPARAATGVAQLPWVTPNSSPASDSSSLYRPPAIF